MVLFGRLLVLRPNGSFASNFPLTVKRITIGSDQQNDIRIYGDSSVHDFHLELNVINKNDCLISSVNGKPFSINGKQIYGGQKLRLQNNDQIKIGQNKTLVFMNSRAKPVLSTPKLQSTPRNTQKSTSRKATPIPLNDGFRRRSSLRISALKTPNNQNLSRISSKSFNISHKSANRLSIKEEDEDLVVKNEETNTSQILSATPIRSWRKPSNLLKLTANRSLNASLSSRILYSPRISSLTKKRSSGLQLESTLNDIVEDNESKDSLMQAINEESLENSGIKKRRSSLSGVKVTSKQSMNASVNSKVINSGSTSTLKKSRISKVSLRSTPKNSMAVNRLENESSISVSLRSRTDSSHESYLKTNTTPLNSTSAKRSANNSMLSTSKRSRLLSKVTDSSDLSKISPQSLRFSVSSTGATNNTTYHANNISVQSHNQVTPIPENNGLRRSTLRTSVLKTPDSRNLSRVSSKSVCVSQQSVKGQSIQENKDLEENNEILNASHLSSIANNSISVNASANTPLSTSVKSLRSSTVQSLENTTPFRRMSVKRSTGGLLLSTANKSRRLSKTSVLSTVNESRRSSSTGESANSFQPTNTTPFNPLSSKRITNNSKLSTTKKSGRDSSVVKLESCHSKNTTPIAVNSFSAKQPTDDSLISTADKSLRLSRTSRMSSQSLETSISSAGATNNTTPHHLSSIESTSLNQVTPIPDYTDVRGVKRLFNNATPAPDYTKVEAIKRTFLRGTPKADYSKVSAVKRILRKGTPKANYSKITGVKRLLQKGTPTANYNRVSGVKRLLQKGASTPDYRNVDGVKRVLKNGTPTANYKDVSGVKRLLQKGQLTPDYRDVNGMKQIFQKQTQDANYNDVSGIEQLFSKDSPIAGNTSVKSKARSTRRKKVENILSPTQQNIQEPETRARRTRKEKPLAETPQQEVQKLEIKTRKVAQVPEPSQKEEAQKSEVKTRRTRKETKPLSPVSQIEVSENVPKKRKRATKSSTKENIEETAQTVKKPKSPVRAKRVTRSVKNITPEKEDVISPKDSKRLKRTAKNLLPVNEDLISPKDSKKSKRTVDKKASKKSETISIIIPNQNSIKVTLVSKPSRNQSPKKRTTKTAEKRSARATQKESSPPLKRVTRSNKNV